MPFGENLKNSNIMSEISNLIVELKSAWHEPREAVHGDSSCPFLLHCDFGLPAGQEEIATTSSTSSHKDFWLTSRSATLFKDGQFAQWGLSLFDPLECENATELYKLDRPDDFKVGDLIIGAFIGDSDLLLLRTDFEAKDYDTVMVVNPIDPRCEWDVAGASFGSFLSKYANHQGAKFWETNLA